MFWLGFISAAAVVGILTLVGAAMVRRDPGTQWETHEDRPIVGPHD
jgi:hypothetical protein